MSKSLLKRVKRCLEKEKPLRLKDLLEIVHLVGRLDKEVKRTNTEEITILWKVETATHLIEVTETLDFFAQRNPTYEMVLSELEITIVTPDGVTETDKPTDQYHSYELLEKTVEWEKWIAEMVDMYLERADEWEELADVLAELEGIQRKIYADQSERRMIYQRIQEGQVCA